MAVQKDPYRSLAEDIAQLVLRHSPSGAEREVDEYLRHRFTALGIDTKVDASGNLVARIAGAGSGVIAITAHKDEIGAIVTDVKETGQLKVRRLGGSFPWVYGEGLVDVLGDTRLVTGVLSFGSRHVSHASPQFAHRDSAPLKWSDAWIETKLDPTALAEAGVRPGTRVVVAKQRKTHLRMGSHIASYALDNKASLAILLELARRVKAPAPEIILLATAKEEIGALGAMYFTRRTKIDALIALDICPLSPEYPVQDGPDPALLTEDSNGIYDDALNAAIRAAAARRNVNLQLAVLESFGSDGSITMGKGHVARAACLAFPAQNTHGYEIAHLGAIAACVDVLEEFVSRPLELDGLDGGAS